MNPNVRLLLVFLAASTAAFAAAPPVDIPGWLAALVAAAAAGLAGLQLLPPSWELLGDGKRAVKRNTPRRVSDRSSTTLPDSGRSSRARSTSFMTARFGALLSALAVTIAVLAFIPAGASAHLSPCGEVCAENHVYNVYNSHCGNGSSWICVNRKVFLDAYAYGVHSWRVTYWFAEQQLPFGGVRECYVDARVDSHVDAVVQFYGEYC